MSYLKIFNGNIITPQGMVKDGTIVVRDGIITEIGTKNPDVPGAQEIDAGGKYISPGFIDMHVHGGGGFDFMDNTVEAFLGVAQTHAIYGTTALMPTTLSCEKQDLLDTLSIYEIANRQNTSGASFIGLHIEGPYFNVKQKGAQDERYIRNPDPAEYKELVESVNFIKRWSAAPELTGALAFGSYLRSKNILPAIAHTDAIYEEVIQAYENGFTHATHFYSCMSGVSRRNAYRYAGVVESAYLIDDMTVEIIADGSHLPAPLLKLVYKIKGPERTALITDAMRGASMPKGESILGSIRNGMKVIIEDGVAKLPDRSSFAGSVATSDLLVRNMMNLADIPLIDAVRMASSTPSEILGIGKQKGTLQVGKDADIVIFDSQINVEKTIIKGNLVYDKNKNDILT